MLTTLAARYKILTSRTAPKHIQWHVETMPKATIKMKHETVDTTSTSFGNGKQPLLPHYYVLLYSR